MKMDSRAITITHLSFLILFLNSCNLFQEKTIDSNNDENKSSLARTSPAEKETVNEECKAVMAKFNGVDKTSPEGKALIKEYYEVCGKPEYEKVVSGECEAVIAKFKGVDKESPEGQVLIEEYYRICEGKDREAAK